MSKVSLSNSSTFATFEQGELISFKVSGTEFIHQKGNPGWRKSDDEMFPVIGPLDKNNFRLSTKKGDGILDQHGLLRELSYTCIQTTKTSATFKKSYRAGTKVKNSKYPNKSSQEFLSWPFDFEFTKHYLLHKNELEIQFTIESEKGMPFMLGYHPAFLLSGLENEMLLSGEKEITLQEVYDAGSNAFPVLNSEELILKHSDKPDVKITTKNFGNFMLWTEVPNMICIEPITQYTSYTDQKFSEENMRISSGKEVFKCIISVENE